MPHQYNQNREQTRKHLKPEEIMLLSIALLGLIIGTIIIERIELAKESSRNLVPVKVESRQDFHSQENRLN